MSVPLEGARVKAALGLFERHVSNLPAESSEPSERRPPVLIRSPVAEEKAEL
jgi:hypothetical protein